jgi:hypothetical protein
MLSHIVADLVRRAYYAYVLIVCISISLTDAINLCIVFTSRIRWLIRMTCLHVLRRSSQFFSVKTRCSCFLCMNAKSYVLILCEGLLCLCLNRLYRYRWLMRSICVSSLRLVFDNLYEWLVCMCFADCLTSSMR